MRIPSKISYFVTGAATLALLAGCSGGSGITTPVTGSGASTSQSVAHSVVPAAAAKKMFTSHSVLRPGIQPLHAKTPASPFINKEAIKNTTSMIAISDAENNVVNVYNPAGSQIAELTGFSEPQGMASDIKGDLYVADTENSRIQKYFAGFQGTPNSLEDPGQYPAGVDSFNNGKVVAVTNIISTSGGAGSVSFFQGGKLVKTISSSSLAEAFFCAFDAKGNLYVTGFDGNFEASVGEIVGGINGTTYTELTTGNALEFPGGIQVTNTGSIVVDDQEGAAVYTYAPPVNGSLGSPTATTPLSEVSDPVTFAFTDTTADLYTADAGLASSQEYAYPAGGSPVSTISEGGEPIGVAVIDTQYPKVTK
jgi:sugar lactone lactonase YvrE